MTNLRATSAGDGDAREQASSWRSFGSVAATLIARAEMQQVREIATEDLPFMPVAWAAE